MERTPQAINDLKIEIGPDWGGAGDRGENYRFKDGLIELKMAKKYFVASLFFWR